MKYYLPTLLKALGLGTRLALMAGAIEMTAKIGMTVVEMWVIDRFGRKVCLVGGSLVMGIGMLASRFHLFTLYFHFFFLKSNTDFVSIKNRSTAHSPWYILATPTKHPMWFVSSSYSSTPWDTAWA